MPEWKPLKKRKKRCHRNLRENERGSPVGLETGLVILNVVFLLIAAFSIPFLLQLWRMAKNIALTLQTLNQSLPGILQNLEEITSNIVSATDTVNSRIEGLSSVIKKIQDTLALVADLGAVIRLPFFKTLVTLSALLKGVRVFLDVFRSAPGVVSRKSGVRDQGYRSRERTTDR